MSTVSTARSLRTIVALLLLLGGLVHLRLYLDGYREVPDIRLGRSFLLNAAASGAAAVAVVLWRNRLSLLAGAAVAAGTLGAFAVSRTDSGIFGFSEKGLQPSPEALVALVVEVLAVAVAAWLLLRSPADDASDERVGTSAL